MAEIAPFRGILYDTSRVDASRVLAPPYDVIDEAGRAELAERDPKNCVRLILPEGEGDEKYGVSARTLQSWITEGILARDPRPAIYRYHQVFTSKELGGREVTRKGFIAATRLHRFDEGVILRHERTLKGPKIDRLKLMRATRAHYSQIFGMYSDPARETDRAFAEAERGEPVLDGTTGDGTRHLVWRVDDREVIGTVQKALAPLKIYIADGHHRYETMLALRDELREAAGGSLDPRSAAEFGTLFLTNMEDEGLVVLPTHRLVHSLPSFDGEAMLEKARAWFDTEIVPGAVRDAEAFKASLAQAGERRPSFAATFPGREDAVLLTLRADFDPKAAGLEGSPAVTRLDVTLLHSLLLEQVLGIDRAAQEAQTHLAYVKDTGKALEKIAAGEGQVCFIMNATPVEQVKGVADADEVMPQKSTFFYPKIASGVVFRSIDPKETVDAQD